MYILVSTKKGKKQSVATCIKKLKNVKTVEIILDKDELLINLEPFFAKNKTILRNLTKQFSKIKGVTEVNLLQVQEDNTQFEKNARFIKHYFFDIDSTLTSGAPGFIHYEVNEIFEKMKNLGVRIYFVTGRAMDDVIKLMKKYPVRNQAIAENGGIIIGFGDGGYEEIGNRTPPVEFIDYLRGKNYNPQEDTEQMGRLTEMVLFRNSISQNSIKTSRIQAKKKGIKVTILESQNSYHITKEGIDKGEALNYLCNKLNIGSKHDEIVSVGDSGLDVPMFKKSHRSFLMGNATKDARKNAPKRTIRLKGKYINGIRQIYEDLSKF